MRPLRRKSAQHGGAGGRRRRLPVRHRQGQRRRRRHRVEGSQPDAGVQLRPAHRVGNRSAPGQRRQGAGALRGDSARAPPGGTLHAKGSVAPDGADPQASLQADQLALAPFRPWRSATRPPAAAAGEPLNLGIEALKLSQMAAHDADSSGSNPWRLDVDRIDLGTALQLSTGGATAQVTAHNLQAQVHAAALTVDDRKPPALALASATLSGGTLDLAAHRAAQILATHRAERIAQFLTERASSGAACRPARWNRHRSRTRGPSLPDCRCPRPNRDAADKHVFLPPAARTMARWTPCLPDRPSGRKSTRGPSGVSSCWAEAWRARHRPRWARSSKGPQ